MPPSKSVRLCLVGCGYMAQANHAPAHRRLQQMADAELAGCCDLDADRARRVQQIAGYARTYTDLRQMLDAERPDALCAAVPYVAMAQTAMQALERGIPVLLEKPPAASLAELDEMIAMAERKSVLTQVAFNRRFMPVMGEFRRRLAAGGRPGRLAGIMSRIRRFDADFTTTAIHLVDTVRHLLGEDYARAALRYEQLEVDGHAVTNYYLDGESVSGISVQLAIRPADESAVEQFVATWDSGRTLTLKIPLPGREREEPGEICESADGKSEQVPGDRTAGSDEPWILAGVLAENAAFIETVRQGGRSELDLRAARQSLEIMLAMRSRQPSWSRAGDVRDPRRCAKVGK